jgi:hypothetical protein
MSDSNDPLANALKILEFEPVKDLLSPSSKEIGELLGTVANLGRFYMTQNLERIFTQWAQFRHGRSLGEHEFKKVMPLLPLASMVSDEELQKRWALLMEDAATNEGCLPSFGQTLAQLTAEEVHYLDRLWKFVSARTDDFLDLVMIEPHRQPLPYSTLVMTFDPAINPGVNAAEMKVFSDRLTEAQKANFERLRRAGLLIDDLIRLGIIVEEQMAEPERFLPLYGDKKIPFERSQTVLRSQYSFSQYGVSFMCAVTAGAKPAATVVTKGRCTSETSEPI